MHRTAVSLAPPNVSPSYRCWHAREDKLPNDHSQVLPKLRFGAFLLVAMRAIRATRYFRVLRVNEQQLHRHSWLTAKRFCVSPWYLLRSSTGYNGNICTDSIQQEATLS